ncbi:hypothetical protein J6590_027329 [Homalodisca vitripennis]|nr:hypothetical protein J6590_027329 [Homalodisca vitripennis]
MPLAAPSVSAVSPRSTQGVLTDPSIDRSFRITKELAHRKSIDKDNGENGATRYRGAVNGRLVTIVLGDPIWVKILRAPWVVENPGVIDLDSL